MFFVYFTIFIAAIVGLNFLLRNHCLISWRKKKTFTIKEITFTITFGRNGIGARLAGFSLQVAKNWGCFHFEFWIPYILIKWHKE